MILSNATRGRSFSRSIVNAPSLIELRPAVIPSLLTTNLLRDADLPHAVPILRFPLQNASYAHLDRLA